jgi:hypothetical protein
MLTPRGCIAGLLAATIALALAARPAAAQVKVCEEVIAVATTTWIADSRIEVGPVAGMINGALYLRYDPQISVDPTRDEANLVVSTKEGDLLLWAEGKATESPDGSLFIDLGTVAARGTGLYAGAHIDLFLTGNCVPEKGGSYKLYGTICRVKPTTRR